jgi:hypothetical protein
LCTADNNNRKLNELRVAEESAKLAAANLTSLFITTYGNLPGSCLYQDSAINVNVTVNEGTENPEDPCD